MVQQGLSNRSLRHIYPKVFGDGCPDYGKGGLILYLCGSRHGGRVHQQGNDLLGVVGSLKGRVIAVIGGDH